MVDPAQEAALHDAPATVCPVGQAMALRLRAAGSNGLVVLFEPPARGHPRLSLLIQEHGPVAGSNRTALEIVSLSSRSD